MSRSAAKTKRRILDAAYELFYRKGFNRVGVDEIAAASRVTKRSLYYHFKSKDELLASVLELQH
jgi:AcrR family transcriptional regulator